MKSLENYGVKELESELDLKTNGGWIHPYYYIVAAVYIEQAVDELVEGVKEGYNAAMQ